MSCRLNLDLTFLSSIKMRETCLHVSKIGIDGLYKAGNYLNYLHFAVDGTAPPMISIFISFTFFRSFNGIYSFKIKMSYFHLASQTIILLTTSLKDDLLSKPNNKNRDFNLESVANKEVVTWYSQRALKMSTCLNIIDQDGCTRPRQSRGKFSIKIPKFMPARVGRLPW